MTRQVERWGLWKFRAETKTLEYPDHDPFVDLAAPGAEELLTQILAINDQPWAEPNVIKDLLHAVATLRIDGRIQGGKGGMQIQ